MSFARADGGPLKPDVPSDLPQGLGASIKEIKAGESYELVVTLTPPLKPGRFHTNLQVKTGLPDAPTFAVPVFATIAGPAKTRPPRGAPPPDERQQAPAFTPGASPPASP